MGFFALLVLVSLLFLVVGLVRPKTVAFVTRKQLSRGKIFALFGGIMFFSFIAFAVTAPPVEKPMNVVKEDTLVEVVTTSTPQQGETIEIPVSTATSPVAIAVLPVSNSTNSSNEIQNKKEESTIVTNPTVEVQKTELELGKIENKSDLYLVTKVVDGDTFDVNINGTIKRVRLIGVDTPETVDPRKPVQCFGKEASYKATELLLNKKVRLEIDPTQGDTDKYGRILRYAFREDRLFYNQWIIENGYAHEYTYNTPYKYQVEFKQAQKMAQEGKKGLWADNACPTSTPPVSTTIAPPTVTTVQPTTPGSCVIKGNINTKGEKLYHLPSCPSYKATQIDEAQGEKWFCTEQDAVKAGWTKAGNC